MFTSDNGGLSWIQQSTGLGGRDVFGLVQAVDGTFVAATSHGIFRLKDSMWAEVSNVRDASPGRSTGATGRRQAAGSRAGSTAAHRTAEAPAGKAEAFDGGVYSLAADGNLIFAVSTKGLLVSPTSGESWTTVNGLPEGSYRAVAIARNLVVVSTLNSLALSADSGTTWTDLSKPDTLSQIAAVAVDDEGDVWVGGREGLFVRRGGHRAGRVRRTFRSEM